ncbi:glycoside hydrolase family 53 protein [Cellvibrio japonicus]|uniref:Arabinogalactan endo-beta-1,4-galactanase n=1 Tax=Cellvibrio japonicus (strain Ueda107) TaxID=498211 RepID=GANA_CELJU|nr:arabinogalactan endo-beta-1,4-galactanase [Cellvibrio japonicus]P48841.1 RecName: Full=Arabinogalactan endo-beta-1,4-galactanase; AltName: Full=Endo-1,4-beta-galactanase; Short=Galactanase; Flags: Precursor [Cellvibrio japonicus Ueda107]ACE83887.1 Arabinogalactan endo-1,4-beta-galactosidase gal53A [Cellvibrio japonicus Ueda107]QEI11194.1 arabinogalactan endo-beta-1,4-galactanase [Cellvibrio japonicus]QEI14768.1 arabinogalactan endo-beta-1,4-galactanase [Cellvibrio japonicus]QEI18348.1 arabi
MKKKILAATAILLAAIANTGVADNTPFYVGADLSYVNEMESCGATYRDQGKKVDPFQLFADKGADLVRVRLWHNATWTKYSDLKDVSKTLKRAKNAGMKTLLDFHYSDTWTDPEKQFIPKAWAHITDTKELAKALYDYTTDTLASLDQQQLLPNLVQVGNETNIEILQAEDTLVHGIPNWQRNATLLNSGVNAVRDYSKKTGKPIQVVLHIAQPENALWWFKQAKENGVIDYDVIGLSYYPQWSEYSLPQLPDAIAELQNTYHKPVMIVETAYPWTLHNFDQAGNVLGEKAVQPEFPASPRGQLTYLLTLTQLVKSAGGMGVIYWEPAWVSTRCRTLWGKGSHWENASFFDATRKNNALPAFLFFKADYQASAQAE